MAKYVDVRIQNLVRKKKQKVFYWQSPTFQFRTFIRGHLKRCEIKCICDENQIWNSTSNILNSIQFQEHSIHIPFKPTSSQFRPKRICFKQKQNPCCIAPPQASNVDFVPKNIVKEFVISPCKGLSSCSPCGRSQWRGQYHQSPEHPRPWSRQTPCYSSASDPL